MPVLTYDLSNPFILRVFYCLCAENGKQKGDILTKEAY